jgi:hypothetical protein
MMVTICVITAITAAWEAFGGGAPAGVDKWGYLLTGLGMACFAVQNLLWPSNRVAAERIHIPAAVFTLIGIVLLVMSNSTGRRI